MPPDALVLKIQRELCHPKCARKVSGLSRNRPLGPVSRKSRELSGPEKPFVKLLPAYSVKLIFSHVVKGIKIKITAKFRASRHLPFEGTKRIMSPETRPKSFGPISGTTIPFISSQRRGSKPSNFAILLIFLILKACKKISFSKRADCSLTTSFSGPKSSRDVRETGPWSGVRFSKDPKTSRGRKLFGALFGLFSRVPESVSQSSRKQPGFQANVSGFFSGWRMAGIGR